MLLQFLQEVKDHNNIGLFKKQIKSEGSEVSENIGQLKMLSPNGKMRETDASNTKLKYSEKKTLPNRIKTTKISS